MSEAGLLSHMMRPLLGLAAILGIVTFSVHTAADDPLRLRVLTWNVWGIPLITPSMDARLRAMPDAIASTGADLILLQELWGTADALAMAKELERFGFAFNHHFALEGYQGNGLHDGTGLFVASRYPLARPEFLAFSVGRVPHTLWHTDWNASKGVGSVWMQTPLGEVLVQNTHLQAKYATDDYAPERLSQAVELALHNRLANPPLLLGGDFNCRADELPRQVLCEINALTDAFGQPSIDTVYVRDGQGLALRALEARQAFTEPVQLDDGVTTRLSDHAAVIVDLELAPCAHCKAEPVRDGATRRAVLGALQTAASASERRVWQVSSGVAATLALGVLTLRRFQRAPAPARIARLTRAAVFALLSVALTWLLYLTAVYYPTLGASLRAAASNLDGDR